MNEDKRLAIIIDANGQAAIGAFDATTGAMGRMTNAADIVGKKSREAGAGVEEAGKKAARSGDEIEASAKRWNRAGQIIGAAIAAVAVGATALVAKAINSADRLDELSQRVSLSTETLSAWGYTAVRSGSNLDTLTGAVEKFSKNVAAAVDGDSKMGKLFDALGIDVIDETTGKLRSIEQLLPQVADKFKRLKDPTLETALAMQLFGRSGGELMEFLNRGSDGIDALTARARELGIVIDGETAAAAAGFNDQVDDMQAAMTGLATKVAAELLPAMTEITAEFTDFASNGDNVTKVASGIANIMEVVGGVFEFVTPYFVAADEAIEGTTWAFQGLYEAANGVINLNWDQVKRGLDLSQQGVRKGGMASTYGLGANLYGTDGDATAARPKVQIIDPAELIADDKRRVAAIKAQREESKRLMALLGDEDGDMAKAQRKASAEARKHEAELKRQQETLKRYTDQAALAAAELEGPLSAATEKHRQRVAELDADLAKHNITQEAYNGLVAASTAELAKQTTALEKKSRAPEILLQQLRQENDLLGLVGRQREIVIRQLQAEEDMRRAIAEAIEGGTKFTQAETKALIDKARAHAEMSLVIEESAAQAEEWASVWVRGVESAADAFTDFIMSGLRDFKSLGSSLKSIAKQIVGDLVRTFLQQKIVIPIQTQITNSMNGQGGGNIFQSILGMFSGNGFSGGGQGNWLSSIGNLFGGGGQGGNWLSSIGSLFGGGSAASAASSAGGTWGGLAGMANASQGIGGASGAAAGGASSMASAVPIIGWIIAGMMKNAELFDQGWDIANGESWAGKIATLGAVGNADKLFRSLGFSDKVSSILSGSSIHAKLFGRKKPQITGQGIEGSYGFGGFDGRTFADIKQKGGLFRSSKYWTEYGTLDNDVDKAFEGAIRAVKGGATSLANQLGIDVSKQLAAVRVNIGKIKLDADPAKAQQQIEAEIAKMVENLSAQAVRALGFGKLLDNTNSATDIMDALSASITLVTGSAEGLGRALQDWETENVTRAVEYFKKLAADNGTSLGTEIERVTGLLGNYASLMSDVDTQLMTNGLNSYQQAQLDIELTYRQQIKAANDYAKALGLSGARAEDLAKIEQLRAIGMANLQKQIDEQKNSLLGDLALSDYSPMTDAEKLDEAMKQLREAVQAGDLDKASQLSQSALGLGRNLYASGNDYNALYDQVTGLIESIALPQLDMDDGTTMGDLADALLALPDQFATALFELLYNPVGPTRPTGGNSTPISTGTNNTGVETRLDETNNLLRDLIQRWGGGGGVNSNHLYEMLR
jgi:hypothetical protein